LDANDNLVADKLKLFKDNNENNNEAADHTSPCLATIYPKTVDVTSPQELRADKLRMMACMCALFEAYCGEWSWKAAHDRLQRPYNLSMVDHVWKIRDRKQRMDIGKYL
jgi:hypothetical protein